MATSNPIWGGSDRYKNATWDPHKGRYMPNESNDEVSLLNYSNTGKEDDTENAYQESAVASNQGQVSDIAALTQSINDILQTGQFNANYSRIPQEYQLETQSSANIADALAGKLGQDEIDLLQQQAAERGVSSGSPLGASTDADYLRALGLTSLDLKNTGQSWLTAATGRNPAAQTMDPTTMLVTPEQQGRQSLAEQELALREQELALEQQRINKSGNRSTGNYRGYGGGGGGNGSGTYGGSNNLWSLLNQGNETGTGSFSYSDAPVTDQELEDWVMSQPYSGLGSGYSDIPSGTYYDTATDTANYDPWADYLGDWSYYG